MVVHPSKKSLTKRTQRVLLRLVCHWVCRPRCRNGLQCSLKQDRSFQLIKRYKRSTITLHELFKREPCREPLEEIRDPVIEDITVCSLERKEMGFKLFILSLAVLAVTVSASSICKCETEPAEKPPVQQDSASKTVEKYTVKMNKDGKDYEEKVEIDTERETETFHVPKTSPDEEAGDIVYDFKQNLTMIRIPSTNSCFFFFFSANVAKPADLKRLLAKKDGVAITKSQSEIKLKVAGTLDDRSHLIDEMVDLCAKLPIYVVVVGELDMSGNAQLPPSSNPPAKRTKRSLWHYVCSIVCKVYRVRICGWYSCYYYYYTRCYNYCRWVYYAWHG